MTPSARTLAYLRSLGYRACVVEQRIPHCFVTRDAFGFADILAFMPKENYRSPSPLIIETLSVILLQTTSRAHHASRAAKVIACPEAREWVDAGNRAVVLSWGLTGAKGKRKKYTERIEELYCDPVTCQWAMREASL